jgi:hypothetical protein
LMMVMYAIGVVVLLIVAVSCILGGGPHLIHFSS